MKLMRRAPHFGAGIVSLIIISILTIGVYKYINLKTINNSLQLTIDEHMNTIDTLNNDNSKLKENISELENKVYELEVRLVNKTPISYKQNLSSRSTDSKFYIPALGDRETLARLVFLEANTESIECQKAIVSVVINRVNSGHWGDTVNSVVYAKNQFTPASRIPYVTPTATNYEAVDYVLANGVTLPSYCLYFRVGYHFSWNGYVPYTSIGNTYFGYMAKDKQ